MKPYRSLLLALAAGFLAGTAALAADDHKHDHVAPVAAAGELIAPTEADAAWLAETRAAYPLKTCLISEEELGGMGAPVEFIYRQPGQADQLVRFCCKMCVPKFKKDPAKYLAQLKAGAKPGVHPHH